MKTYLQMDGDRLVEYVEKREYDAVVLALHDMTNLLDSEKSTRNHMIKRGAELERELNAEKQERADFGALVDEQERKLGDLISLLASEKSAQNYLIILGADLKRELNTAKELIREIRDNEVNAVDEATKFLRDYPIIK